LNLIAGLFGDVQFFGALSGRQHPRTP